MGGGEKAEASGSVCKNVNSNMTSRKAYSERDSVKAG